MTLQIVSGGQVCGFTPEGIHYARPILALHLVNSLPLPDISYWLDSHNAQGTNCQPTQLLQPANCPDIMSILEALVTSPRSRPKLPRGAKKENMEEEVLDKRSLSCFDLLFEFHVRLRTDYVLSHKTVLLTPRLGHAQGAFIIEKTSCDVLSSVRRMLRGPGWIIVAIKQKL